MQEVRDAQISCKRPFTTNLLDFLCPIPENVEALLISYAEDGYQKDGHEVIESAVLFWLFTLRDRGKPAYKESRMQALTFPANSNDGASQKTTEERSSSGF